MEAQTNQQETTALMAREMNSRSPAERARVLDDIHGVAEVRREDPAKVEETLSELDRSLQSLIASRQGPSVMAYEEAMRRCPSYVLDKEFRLSFLRAEKWNATLAADRFLRFFEEKLELFGSSKLCSDITLADLEAGDLEVLNNGHLQLLEKRDQAGRLIMCNLNAYERWQQPVNLLRAIYYMTMAAAEDVQVQRQGLVGVVYSIRLAKAEFNAGTLDRSIKLRNALPVRYSAMHYCYNSAATSDRINYEILASDSSTRARCRVHKVSAMECRYALSSFGIPAMVIPVTILGRLKTEQHEAWIGDRRKEELRRSSVLVPSCPPSSATFPVVIEANSETSCELAPNLEDPAPILSIPNDCMVQSLTSNDVLFGRGKAKEHPGNVFLHQLISSRRDRYEKAEKWEKTVIAEEIVAEIKERSGRFLKAEKGGWTEVNVETAREKVSHTFRSRRPKASGSVSLKRKRVGDVFTSGAKRRTGFDARQ